MVNPSGASNGTIMPNTAEWIKFHNGSSSLTDVSCWFFSSEERKVIDVNHLDKGIYFLTIHCNGKFFFKKLMYQ